ncbi:hypothetical protein AWC38_SpisGene10836 [Stylophora pistillata]|uniref:Uncharacterized protein n=1 Tax=Stylophora pistillata TaxID=50429 RepID=A0A2B4S587_STYPI|nr:hypothetical protein AWC38_SpisGene10836 [Stylophora pistillata]
MDNMSSDQSSQYAVKRCVQLSPPSLQPSKRVSKNLPCESSCVTSADELSKRMIPKRSAKQLSFSTSQVATVLTPTSSGDSRKITSMDQAKRTTSIFAEQPSFSTPQDASVIATSTGHDCAATSVDQSSRLTTPSFEGQPFFSTRPAVLRPKSIGDNDCTSFEAQSLLTERRQKIILQAVSNKDATVLTAILKDHFPSVVDELKKTISEELKTSCAKLCKRSQGSVLYGNEFKSKNNFDFNKVWVELKTSRPYLVEILNAVSGKDKSVSETKRELQVKTLEANLHNPHIALASLGGY